MRRPPRKHKVREHGRSKPRGGRTGVDEYARGRDGSTTSSSAGGRAHARNVLLRANDARVARAKARKLARAARKRSERRAFVEVAKRKGGALLDHALGVELDVYYEENKGKGEDEELLL